MKKIHLKLKALERSQHFSQVYWDFSDAQGQVTNKSLIRFCQIACKNEKDPIKNEGARVVTTLFIDFSDAQGQISPLSVMESCQNSNPSKLL